MNLMFLKKLVKIWLNASTDFIFIVGFVNKLILLFILKKENMSLERL